MNMDLRVIRTKESIKNAFEEMICEMNYEKITVKELTKRARINRKTFYLHYSCLDELLYELQNEMAQHFIERTQNLKRPEDLDQITREFYLECENNRLSERLICNCNYYDIGRKITSQIMKDTWKTNSINQKNQYIQNIIMVFVSQSTIEIYRQWVRDGKKVSLDKIIELTANLICNGLNEIIN